MSFCLEWQEMDFGLVAFAAAKLMVWKPEHAQISANREMTDNYFRTVVHIHFGSTYRAYPVIFSDVGIADVTVNSTSRLCSLNSGFSIVKAI